MASTKYIGYVGGVAVAVGVGAAVAAAGQGIAHADDSDSGGTQKSTSAGPVKKAVDKAADNTRTNIHAAASKIADAKADVKADVKTTVDTKKVSDTKPFAKLAAQTTTTTPKFSEAEQVKKLQNLFKPKASSSVDAVTTAAAPTNLPDPFRLDEPIATNIPISVQTKEANLLAKFNGPIAPLAPYVREGYEAAWRFSQVVKVVNVPAITADAISALQLAAQGDTVGSQEAVNALLLATPWSVVYYGYDEAADLLNLEPEGAALKEAFYATVWDTVDPAGLFHPLGQGGTTIVPETPFALSSVTTASLVTKASLVTNDVAPTIGAAASIPWSPNPFRADDPAPDDMPQAILNVEQQLMNAAPRVAPFTREGVELAWRVSQMIPWVNVIYPVINIAHDLPLALGGDKAASQAIVNNLIMTIEPFAILYYGWDEIADLLNLEAPGADFKNQFFATAWKIDFLNLLHVPGESGVPLNPNSGWTTVV